MHITSFPYQRVQKQQKKNFSAFLIQMPNELELNLQKIGQGQPRIMFHANFVVLKSMMLHTKFQGNWPSGSGKKVFKCFCIFEHGSQIGLETMNIWLSFLFSYPMLASYQIYVLVIVAFFFFLLFLFFLTYGLKQFSTQVTMAKVTKCPCTCGIHMLWSSLLFHTLEYKSNKKHIHYIFSFSHSNAYGTKLDLAVK